jgi:DNA-3-methyladenine glycosylase I
MLIISMKERCWPNVSGLMAEYHDTEWGVPLHDDQKLFEFLILDGFQAGLSWSTILNKREAFRSAFKKFDYTKIAAFSTIDIETLMQNSGIIRNRAKITATILNAQALLKIRTEFGSFNNYLWNFTDYQPIQSNLKSFSEMPAQTELSQIISRDLQKYGFKFVGPTIIYAFMQAIGMINDHLITCFRYPELQLLK